MILASDSWAAAQAAMRGQFDVRGRSSLFDSVQGVQGIGQQLAAPFDAFNQLRDNTLPSSLDRLNKTAAGAISSFNTAFNNDEEQEG